MITPSKLDTLSEPNPKSEPNTKPEPDKLKSEPEPSYEHQSLSVVPTNIETVFFNFAKIKPVAFVLLKKFEFFMLAFQL